jgi:hypothetical protein
LILTLDGEADLVSELMCLEETVDTEIVHLSCLDCIVIKPGSVLCATALQDHKMEVSATFNWGKSSDWIVE